MCTWHIVSCSTSSTSFVLIELIKIRVGVKLSAKLRLVVRNAIRRRSLKIERSQSARKERTLQEVSCESLESNSTVHYIRSSIRLFKPRPPLAWGVARSANAYFQLDTSHHSCCQSAIFLMHLFLPRLCFKHCVYIRNNYSQWPLTV